MPINRQKTSFSLDGEDDTLIEGTVGDINRRLTSGSLGCLDKYTTVDISEVEPAVDKCLSLTRSGSGSGSGSSDSVHDASSSRILAIGERSVKWAEPRIKVIPPTTGGRSVLLAMHSEYTR